jgi:hypothetical protein
MLSTDSDSGATSASVLIIVLVGLASGALYGGLLGQFISHAYLLAVLASFLAVVTASVVRYLIVTRGAEAPFPGGGPAALPRVLLVNSLIASIFGGLAAHGVLVEAAPNAWPVVTGAGGGLCGAILMALLMIAYYSARAGRVQTS